MTTHTYAPRSAVGHLVRHLWSGDREVRKVFPDEVLQRIEQAVTASEQGHRAELRVAIEGGLGWACRSPDVPGMTRAHARAIALFSGLGVWDTEENSGVLIYVLMAEHRLEILADRGISAHVSSEVWQRIVDDATARFKSGDHAMGLLAAIEAIGSLLCEHFPASGSNPDELPNKPVVF